MSTQRFQGFLASLNTAQRVILFICALPALAMLLFPPWVCIGGASDFDSHYNTPPNQHLFLLNWGGMSCWGDGAQAVVNVPRLLGQLVPLLAVALLGYFWFKTPGQPEMTASAPAQSQKTTPHKEVRRTDA